MNKKRSLVIGVSIVLSLVIVLAATFAWITSKDSVLNRFKSHSITDGSVKIQEIFSPPEDWKPGQKITKLVSAVNEGDGPVLVRVSFEEIMNLLKNGGVATQYDAVQTEKTPLLLNAAAYSATDWKNASEVFTTITGVSDSKIIIRTKSADDNSTIPAGKVHTFAIYYDNDDGTYTRMSAKFQPSGDTLAVSEVKYYYYEGYDQTKAAWSTSNEETGVTPTPPTLQNINYPVTDPGKKISLQYTAALKTTMEENNWWYHAADGFFYYIGKLEAGATSAALLESLTLALDAGPAYTSLQFDLYVKLEAIQNTRAALTSTEAGGWGLTNTELVTALSAFCDN